MSNFEEISLSVVCPVANERDSVQLFIEDVLARCKGFEKVTFFVVLDRVSTDGTREIVETLAERDPRVKLVWAPENRCVVDAYLRGYREAIASGADWILEIDAGYSHQPSEIPLFFEEMAKGRDAVFGSRFMPGASMQEASLHRRLISRGGTILTNFMLGTRLCDMTSGFELFSRPTLEKVLSKGIRSRAHFFQTEIKVHCRNLNIVEVPIHYRSPSASVNGRIVGESLLRLSDLFFQRLRGTL